MKQRLTNILARLKHDKLDCLFLTHPANISYLTDSTSRDSYLIVSPHKNIYFTDSRYTEEAKATINRTIAIQTVKKPIFEEIAAVCKDQRFKRIGFESKFCSFASYQKLSKLLGNRIHLIPTQDLVEDLRQIKDQTELSIIRQAVEITVQALNFIRPRLKPGKTELAIAAEIERFIRLRGARGPSFDIIVASGPNSSYPHHITSDRKLKATEAVVIDMGVDVKGYKSDLTRTFFLGKMTSLAQKVYATVRQAQEAAIKELKPNVFRSTVDRAARSVIANAGYAACFGHNLGHGVGLEIHEAPSISAKSDLTLKPGMVFTIEPGIYLPGKFGVRIEDMVLITENKEEILSGSLNK